MKEETFFKPHSKAQTRNTNKNTKNNMRLPPQLILVKNDCEMRDYLIMAFS